MALHDRGRLGAEEIADHKFAMPAPEPLDVLLFLVELSQSELLLCDLTLQLGDALPALRYELRPFRPTRFVVQLAQTITAEVVDRRSVEGNDIPIASTDEFEELVERFGRRGRHGERPAALPELGGTGSTELAPDGDPVARRLRGELHDEHRPSNI